MWCKKNIIIEIGGGGGGWDANWNYTPLRNCLFHSNKHVYRIREGSNQTPKLPYLVAMPLHKMEAKGYWEMEHFTVVGHGWTHAICVIVALFYIGIDVKKMGMVGMSAHSHTPDTTAFFHDCNYYYDIELQLNVLWWKAIV